MISNINLTAAQLAHLRFLAASEAEDPDALTWERRYVYRGRHECTSHGWVSEWHAPTPRIADIRNGNAPRHLNRPSMDRLVALGLAQVRETKKDVGSEVQTERVYNTTEAGRAFLSPAPHPVNIAQHATTQAAAMLRELLESDPTGSQTTRLVCLMRTLEDKLHERDLHDERRLYARDLHDASR